MPIIGKVKHPHQCPLPPAGSLDKDIVFLCGGPDGCGKKFVVSLHGDSRDGWHAWERYEGPVEFDMGVK